MLLICKYQIKEKKWCTVVTLKCLEVRKYLIFFIHLQMPAINCSLNVMIYFIKRNGLSCSHLSAVLCQLVQMFSRAVGCFITDSCFRVPSWSRWRRILCPAHASQRTRFDSMLTFHFSHLVFSLRLVQCLWRISMETKRGRNIRLNWLWGNNNALNIFCQSLVTSCYYMSCVWYVKN